MHLEEREREREREKTCFLVAFNISMSYIFPENLIEILRVIQKI